MIIIILCIVLILLHINQIINVDLRFQESNKIEQLWRYRFYLYIPFLWTYYSIIGFKIYIDKRLGDNIIQTSEYRLSKGKELWKLLIGIQQGKMKWYWTPEEVFSKIRKKE
tara:strand:- start:4359 stop:4691 length:333 start_codon:yes stop_codon:yes gene_type:complete